jgi:hypothetical protein
MGARDIRYSRGAVSGAVQGILLGTVLIGLVDRHAFGVAGAAITVKEIERERTSIGSGSSYAEKNDTPNKGHSEDK